MPENTRPFTASLLLIFLAGCSEPAPEIRQTQDSRPARARNVVLFIGVGGERVHGVIEQNRIFDIMMAAYGWDAD